MRCFSTVTSRHRRPPRTTRHIARSADATTALAAGLERTTTTLPALRHQADALNTKLVALTNTVGMVEQHLETLPRPVDAVLNQYVELQGALNAVAEVLATVTTDAKALAGHSAEHAQSVLQAHRVISDTGALQKTTETVQKLLGNLAATVEQLNTRLDTSTAALQLAMDAATTSLEANVHRSADTARLFGERLTDVAQIIIDRTHDGRHS